MVQYKSRETNKPSWGWQKTALKDSTVMNTSPKTFQNMWIICSKMEVSNLWEPRFAVIQQETSTPHRQSSKDYPLCFANFGSDS